MSNLRARYVLGRILPVACFLIVSAIISIYRFDEVSSSQSFGWDSGSFLENGAVYAGLTQYNQAYDPTRPPVLPVLLSLAFRITGPSVMDGYLLSGILYFVAMLACYLLAREIMNPWLAVLPAISYGLAPMVIEWGGIVYSNVEGVAIAALGLATFVYAVKYRSSFYLIALPLMFLAPLTRYTLGIILFVAVIYILSYKAKGGTLKPRSPYNFSVGVGIAIVAIGAVGTIWIAYPLSHGYNLTSLFPSAGNVNPFTSPLGHFYWAFNLPNELGSGMYMYVIAATLIITCTYIFFSPILSSGNQNLAESDYQFSLASTPGITRSLTSYSAPSATIRKAETINPLVYALLFWFVGLFLFYSIAWSYYDPRYSVEFIFPGLILAFWGIDRALTAISRQVTGRRMAFGEVSGSNSLKMIASIIIVLLIVAGVGLLVAQSGMVVVQNTPVVDTSLNAGMRQAASWVKTNVPISARLEGDWYTFLWWYLPNYTILEAPAAYQLTSNQSYTNWVKSIYTSNVSYVIYSNSAAINVPPQFQPVFRSNVSGVTVFKVSSS